MEGRKEQTWYNTCSLQPLAEILLLSILTGPIFHLIAAQTLPGTVDHQHWACVGNEGSYVNMDANCTSGQVIALTGVKVGAKPNEFACPKSVNSSTIFDPDTCCQPNQTNDCIIDYPISTLKSFCSGQTQCQSSVAESMPLNDTSCNTTVYGTKTSYMSLEYQCIEGTRVSEMCTSVSLSTTSFIYLWNRHYGATPPLNNTIPASDTSCTCSLETDSCAASILAYSVDTDLADFNGTCEQELQFTDETGASAFKLSCNYYKLGYLFTVSSNYLHVKLENSLGHSDGRFWLGFKASDSSSGIHLNCPAVNRSYCINSTTEKPYISTNENVSISSAPTTAKVKGTNATDITFPTTGPNNIQTSSGSPVAAGVEKNNSGNTTYEPGLNKWMILLIVLAAVLLFILLIIVVICLVCCKSETQRRKRVRTLKKCDVEKADRPKTPSKRDEHRSSIGSVTDLQHKLAQEYYKDPERTTINSSNFPSELATPAVYPNHHLTPQENTTPAKESFDIPTSNSKRSSKSRNSLDSKTGIETGNEKKSQFLTSHLPDTGKKPERKKSKRKKKRAQQDAQGETINDPTIHPPPLYSSGYIRANIIIEGDFPIAVPENGRSHSLSLTKKEKRRKRLKACKGPPASGMLRYDDISSKRSNRNLDDKSESQKGGRHPLKSKVAPEMTQRQHNYNAINNAHHNRDAYKSADVEMNTIHYRDVDERHATGNIERQETDVKTSYGNHSFVHDRKVPQSTKRQRHHVEIWNVSDSNVHDIDFDGYRG